MRRYSFARGARHSGVPCDRGHQNIDRVPEGSFHLRSLDCLSWMSSCQGRSGTTPSTSLSESRVRTSASRRRPLMFGPQQSAGHVGLGIQPPGVTREQGHRARLGVGREETRELQRSLLRRGLWLTVSSQSRHSFRTVLTQCHRERVGPRRSNEGLEHAESERDLPTP